MISPPVIMLMCFIISHEGLYGQDIDHGPGFQTSVMKNPAFAGSNGESMLRLSYLNLLPGRNYNLHSVYASYDSYFPAIHGGAGFYVANDYIGGIINDIKGGLSYSYFLQAGKDFFINAGLSASFIHRGFNFGNAVLPDMIDNMGGVSLPTSDVLSEKGRSVVDVGTGFLFIWNRIFAGFSILHLAEPDLSGSGASVESLKRKYSIVASGELEINKKNHLNARPMALLELQGDYFIAGAGSVIESNHLSVNALVLADNNKNIDIQTGFSIHSGSLIFLYNYRFNLSSVNQLYPFSLVHQTGLAFSLNNVEKRIRVKTIKIPEL